MKPRLRSMMVDADHSILVLDRFKPDTAEHLIGLRKIMADGADAPRPPVLILPFEVDLGDDGPEEGLTVHADEIEALRWAIDALSLMPVDRLGELHPTHNPTRYLDALRLLLQRAEQ
jgi:hypothetical protein